MRVSGTVCILTNSLQNITENTIWCYDSKPTARIMRKRIFTDIMTGKITPLIGLNDEQEN